MTEPGSATGNDSGNSNNLRKLILVVSVLGVAAAIFVFSRGEQDGNGGGGVGGGGAVTADLDRRLELNRTALAATENLEAIAADQAWSELREQLPEDTSVALNRAINRVLLVDQLSGRATNASLDNAQQKDARSQLSDAIPAARAGIDDYEAAGGNAVLALWLRSRVDLHEAALLPGSLTKSLRKQIYERLAAAIRGDVGGDPGAIILGGTLIQVVELLEDPIDGLPQDLLTDAAKTVGALSNQHPDNLFFALRAARLNIETKDAVAAEYVRRANELARAIEPSIRRETRPIGVTPDELVAQIVTAIESADWNEAENRMLLWFNVLNSTEIVKTDRRRASPHPLDRLSFDSLRRLSAEAVEASPLAQGSQAIPFEPQPIEGATNVAATAVIDYDLDLDSDLVSADGDGLLRLWSNDGAGQFSSAGQLNAGMPITGLVIADLFVVDSSNPGRIRADSAPADADKPDYSSAVRHNTFPSLLAFGADGVRLIQVDGRQATAPESRLSLVDGETGLEQVRGVTAAIAGDLEADGDLDLVLATETDGIRLFANRGNRTFFEVTGDDNAFAADDPATALAIADLDRDLDLDIITAHPGSGRVGMLENMLHLQFRGRFLEDVPAIEGLSTVSVEDVDGNVSWDLIVGGEGGAAIVFSQTADANAWTVDRVVSSEASADAMIVDDFDNDSWMEVIAASPDETRMSRIGPWGFGDWQPVANVTGPGNLVAAHFDKSKTIDLAGISDGTLQLFVNGCPSPGHHVDVRFKGIDDNASGRVNHYAIGSVLEMRFGPHYRARIVKSPSTHFGVDGFDTASSLRAILPNGLTQMVRDPAIDSIVEEEQTLKGSCPYLYAWDGEKYVFVTDCLWAAPLGLQVASGIVAKDRPWEYLKLDGESIKPRGDRYEFRITEELWEVAYFDELALTVVDHPADVDVWTNEKVGPAEIATPTIFAFAHDQLHPIVSAVDTKGRDVTELLGRADREFVQGFDYRLRQGLCEPHWIDLDFGEAELPTSGDQPGKSYLVLTGWILPTDTSLNIQIDQNPELGPIEFPSVWVPDAGQPEGWREAIPTMGFPGGKTKTIVVDVTDVLNEDDLRFRIRTSAQIYWDSAQLALVSDPPPVKISEVDLIAAEVGFHGFSAPIRLDPTHPERYEYQQATQASRWPPLRGRLTRFGDCTDLIRQWDDQMVVISSGDEIRVQFTRPAQDPPPGWKRDFILHCVGWDKDADLNTLSGQSSEPLPYREMTEYPPSPGNEARQQQLERLNRDHLLRTQSFRSFWFRGLEGEPSRFHDVSVGEN